MPKARDRFVQTVPAKKLLKGSGAVALLKPDWADANEIRNGMVTIEEAGKKRRVRVYSVLDIATYKAKLDDARQVAALESDAVATWRFVVDQASEDGNDAAESWANGHLLTAIAESDQDIVDVSAIAFD